MQQYLEFVKEIESFDAEFEKQGAQTMSEAYQAKLKKMIGEYPGQISRQAKAFSRYVDHLSRSGKSKHDVDAAIALVEKVMSYASNAASAALWTKYIDFLQELEDVYPRLQGEEHSVLEAEREKKVKLVFERALENVGHNSMASAEIWIKYIDFETMRNNLSLVNLLCYMALETPLLNGQVILDKYIGILENLYERIFERITADAKQQEGEEDAEIPEKHRAKYKQIVDMITGEFKGDKQQFINHVKTTVFTAAKAKAAARMVFQENLDQAPDVELPQWQKYIDFEISQSQPQRAKLLYEQALASSTQAQNDIKLWLQYMSFIQDTLKDASLVRAKFEQKLNDSQLLSPAQKVDILIENAVFEELQQNYLRARRLYEQLDQEIAPGFVKAAIARINFEKRQGNADRARELYFNAFMSALTRSDRMAVAYIATQYARFLAFKCNDHARALEIYSQAAANAECASKVLFLSYANLARNLNSADAGVRVKEIFEKAITQLSKNQSPTELQDLQDVCLYYVTFMEEEALNAADQNELKEARRRLQAKGYLNSANRAPVLATIQNQLNASQERLGGVGRKRPNTESVQQLESQV